MLKFCLALPRAKVGGSFTFLRNFQAYLTAQGIPWTNDLNDHYDVLFFNSWTIPYSDLLHHKKRLPGLRVVQRVDGSAQDYGRYDGADWLQRDANALADLTIFQSHYSYNATFERYKLIRQPGPVIHNPVDIERFTPEGAFMAWEPHPQRVISVGWSSNPMKGNGRIPALAQQHPEVEFVVVGNADNLPTLPNLRLVSYLEHDQLPQALRSASLYLSLILNDACPNVILEALASGLPVLYVPSGGVPELVREAGLPFQTEAEFAPALGALLAGRAHYAQKARQLAVREHHPERIFAAYLSAIETAQRRPLPPAWVNGRAWLDQQLFILREQPRKWRRILTGQQPLRKAK